MRAPLTYCIGVYISESLPHIFVQKPLALLAGWHLWFKLKYLSIFGWIPMIFKVPRRQILLTLVTLFLWRYQQGNVSLFL